MATPHSRCPATALAQDQVSLQFTSRVSLTSLSAALLPPSMLSFVVPAPNEQGCLGRTVQAIHAAARATGRPYEVIVVDDASTDATAEVARKHDATVVSVNRRQIAATRNAGGRTAPGGPPFFVDAHPVAPP